MTRDQAIKRVQAACPRYDELGSGALVDAMAALGLIELETPTSDREDLIRKLVYAYRDEACSAEKAMTRIQSLFPEIDKFYDAKP